MASSCSSFYFLIIDIFVFIKTDISHHSQRSFFPLVPLVLYDGSLFTHARCDEKGVEWILSDFPEEHVMEKKRQS